MNLCKQPQFSWMLVSLLILATGCVHRSPVPAHDPSMATFSFEEPEERRPIDPEWLQPSKKPYTLGPGDMIEIEVVGEPTTRTVAPVGPDGKIYFYSLPGMDVWGMTPSEVRIQLERALETFFRDPPRVSVIPRRVVSQKVWLLGRLNAPGVYPLEGPTTLLEAIANAGGPEASPVFAPTMDRRGSSYIPGSDEAGDLRRAFVIRDGEVLPVDLHRLLHHGDMSQNIYLQSDDLVHLPTAGIWEVHVLGGVVQPRAVAHTGQTTLVAAISAAGGPTHDAHMKQVAVVRGGTGEPQIVVVDFNDVIRGRMSDIPLEPHDIVYVPLSPHRHMTRYIDLILSSFARTIGINAGSRAMSRDRDTDISLPIGIGQ